MITSLPPSAVFVVELDGLLADSLYDQVEINGAADLQGTIDLSLGFTPTLGDSFMIVTTTGVLTSDLPRVVRVMHNSVLHSFLVHKNNNSIILEFAETGCVINKTFTAGAMLKGLFSASVDIISTDAEVIDVTVLSAPTVILNPEFTVPVGICFDIVQDGCN